jgi:acyl-ACP thioesterase
MANIHAQSLGFGFDNLISSGVIWVLSRIHVQFKRLPVWKEKLSIETWHKGSDRLFGFRDFLVTDEAGKEIIAATSSWLIIDYKTRRLKRIDSVLGSEFKSVNQKDAIRTPAEKLTSPDNLCLTSAHKTSISDLDINGHANNARYLEWAMDSLPWAVSKELIIKELWINFNNESLPGDNIEIFTSDTSDIFIEGKKENLSVFQIKIT